MFTDVRRRFARCDDKDIAFELFRFACCPPPCRRVAAKHGPGNACLDMLGVFAEFEPNLRRERQLAGIS